MATACIPQITFGFEPKGKPIIAAFDQAHASSDGGAVLLKSLDTQRQLTKRLAGCLVDTRQPGKVQHQALELVRQRVFGLACGYADGNDAARVADDAIHKLLLDRDPIAGRALASQPTLSRFENSVPWDALRDMAHVTGRHRDRNASAAAQGVGDPDHDRPGSHRRPDPWPAGAHLLQRPLRHGVLPADRGDGDVQRRAASTRSSSTRAPARICGPNRWMLIWPATLRHEKALIAAKSEPGTRTLKDTVNDALRRVASRRDRRMARALDTLAKAKLADRSVAWR
jgi:Transposase DDE domain group 1